MTELANQTAVVFSEDAIRNAIRDMNLSFKVAQIAATQAFSPLNQMKLWLFKTLPPPTGVQGVPIHRLIDVDEFSFQLKDVCSKHGYAPIGKRVLSSGPYTRTTATTCLLAVFGDGHKHVRIERGGVGVDEVVVFFTSLVQAIAQRPGPFVRYAIMCDNLYQHHSAEVFNVVTTAGHHLVFRPPYQPWEAPVEYAIQQVELRLSQKVFDVSDQNSLENEVLSCVAALKSLPETFTNRGYPY